MLPSVDVNGKLIGSKDRRSTVDSGRKLKRIQELYKLHIKGYPVHQTRENASAGKKMRMECRSRKKFPFRSRICGEESAAREGTLRFTESYQDKFYFRDMSSGVGTRMNSVLSVAFFSMLTSTSWTDRVRSRSMSKIMQLFVW